MFRKPKKAAPLAITNDAPEIQSVTETLARAYHRLNDLEVVVLVDELRKPYTILADGQLYSHVANDSDGHWIYRLDK